MKSGVAISNRCICCRHFTSRGSVKCKKCLKSEVGTKNLLKQKRLVDEVVCGRKVQKVIPERTSEEGLLLCKNVSVVSCDGSIRSSLSESNIPSPARSSPLVACPSFDVQSDKSSCGGSSAGCSFDCITDCGESLEVGSFCSSSSVHNIESIDSGDGSDVSDSGDERLSDSGDERSDVEREEELLPKEDEKEYQGCPCIVDYGFVVECERFCLNCHRCESDGFDGLRCYTVVLQIHNTNELSFRRKKWMSFKKEDCRSSCARLCKECFECVRKKPQKDGNKWINIWPVYMWKVLSNVEIHNKYGSDVLKFVPLQWHGFWKAELVRLFPGVFSLETFQQKICTLCVDITFKRKWFRKVREELSLGVMKTVCNSLLVPVCLCPWGCASYYFEDGCCDFDAVLHRYLSFVPCTGTACKAYSIEKLLSAREDFFGEPDMHLFNPDWKVLPSVYFQDDVGPVFLSCKEHNGGTSFKYFHLPKSHSILPSRYCESMSPAVFRSRTLKPTVPMKYSNGYRLQKCTATYCGVDTAYISEQRHFDFLSHIDDLNEACSFTNRDDIKGLASGLVDSGTLCGEYLENLKERGELLFGGNKDAIDAMRVGSTVITLPEAIKLQSLLASSGAIQLQGHDSSFIPNWPSTLIFVHQQDGYGSKFADVPVFRCTGKKKTCLVSFWFLCHCLCSVVELWEELHKRVEHVAVEGFLLSYLARNVLKQKGSRGKKKNPFYVNPGHPYLDPEGLLQSLLRSANITAALPRELLTIFGKLFDESRVNIVEVKRALSQSLCDAIEVGGGCTEDCRVLVVYGEGNLIEERVLADGHVLELRLVAITDGPEDANKPNSWTGEVWRRHGVLFKNWWVTRRSQTGNRTLKKDTMTDCDMEKVSFAIYCRVEDVKYCDIRRQYLKYIGGQNHVFCKTHDVPLITSKVFRKKSSKRCCNIVHGSLCGGHEDICCPVDECNVCICKQCRKQCPEDVVTYIVCTADVESKDTMEDTMEDDGDEACGVVESDDESYHSEESDNESWIKECPASLLHTGCDAPMFDIEQLPGGENEDGVEDELAFEGIIPTTLSGAMRTSFENSIGSMGTSVLLNKFGTVLVRRDNRLQASRRERNMVEKVVARESGNCIPLLYLEGMMFPSIFWSHPDSARGGLLGSIPTALFCQHETRRRFHIASLADHAKVRLKCCGSSASTNPNYLAFLFDCLANGALEGQDTRVVLSRGFEESMGPAGMRMRNGEDDFYTDTIDNRQCCHNLCASERDKPNSLFLTLTCNQREHFGIAQVKRYVDSPEALENYKAYIRRKFPALKELSPKEEDEVRFAFQEAARNLIVRNWMEVRLLLIRYLLKSPEKPLGEMLKIFVRDEYQKEAGNLSHLHILITLAEGYDCPEGKEKIESLIRGFIDEIVGLDEVHSFIEEGIFKNWTDYEEMKEEASRILPHSCNSHRCLRRVGPHSTELVCRVPDTRKLSTDLMNFYEKDIEVEHNGEAVKIYEQLGFCDNITESDGKFSPRVDFLKAKRILAPARFGEGNITPVVGKLFAATRSSMNIQICTSFGTSRYVVKYITKIDENNYVVFSVSEGNHEVYKAELVNLHNTKIASSAINEAKKLKASRHRNRPKGRAIAATEMMQIMLGFPQVYTNVEYIKVQTLPLGDRPGLERMSPEERYEEKLRQGYWANKKPPDLYDWALPDVFYRSMFVGDRQQQFRLFTDSQCTLLEDQVHSPITVDRVTIFGVRPPELLFIDKMEWYFKYFHRSKKPIIYSKDNPFDSYVTNNLDTSYWIDGLGFRIRLRPKAIMQLSNILGCPSFQARMKDKGYIKMLQLLRDVFSMYRTAGITVGKQTEESPLGRIDHLRWTRIQNAIIATELEDSMLPIPVFSNVRPKNATKFVIHVLLSMGHFETEADLWAMHSLRDAFVSSRLLTVENVRDIDQSTCDDLLKEWIQDQLQYYPISSRTMDDYVCSAYSIFQAILLRDEVPIDEIPPCLYTGLVDNISDSILEYKKKVKSDLITATLNGLSSACRHTATRLPTHESLMQAAKSNTVPEAMFCISDTQSAASYVEQENAVRVAKNAIMQYCTPSNVYTRGVIVTGPPGAGKTHCLLQCILFALCKGLFAITTAILAERAFLLGGQHFHKLFQIPVRDHGYRVHRMAELAVVSLQKKPESVCLLRSLDVLFVDEMGQVSAELLSVLDIIMRRIRDSSLFMGGVLVIATLDQVQLRPIKELPFLLSPYVITCFRMVKLKHYVRCSDCSVLQEMNEIARFFSSDTEEVDRKLARFRTLVSSNCTFVASWDDLENMDDVLRIFPKRKHAMEATRAFLAAKKKSVSASGGQYVSRKACDTMVPLESHGDWGPASATVVKQLNRKATEPEQIDFFEGAVYQFTFNSPTKFNTTQLCVLLEVPSQQDLDSFAAISVMAAPPGTKVFSMNGIRKEDLVSLGWKEVLVGPAPEYVQPMWHQGVKAKRKQYGLKHHVASTVHSAIGHTLCKVATELSTAHGLWERAMVVVLISRVKHARDIIFVGNKKENIDALIKGLKIRCQYDDYMNHVVDVLCGDANNSTRYTSTVDLLQHPYRPRDIQLPVDTTGVVYLLASTKKKSAVYVGFTQNIRLRLKQHNSGYGSQSTTDSALRPWALVAYVTGFSGDRKLMQQFEKSWQQKNVFFSPSSLEACISLAEQLVADEYSSYSLIVVKSIITA